MRDVLSKCYEFAEVGLKIGHEERLKLLVWHVQLMLRMPTPVHGVLIDGYVDGILDVFLYQLLV